VGNTTTKLRETKHVQTQGAESKSVW